MRLLHVEAVAAKRHHHVDERILYILAWLADEVLRERLPNLTLLALAPAGGLYALMNAA